MIYIVARYVEGFPVVDEGEVEVVGAFTDERVANRLCRLAGSRARVQSVSLDTIESQWRCLAQDLRMELPDDPARGLPC